MQFVKSKTAAISIAIIFIISIGASTLMVPSTFAQQNPGWQVPTFAYINVAPNPVGVGQKADIIIWVDKPRVNALLANEYRLHNYNLTILDSNNTVVVSQFWENVVDPTSSQYYAWTPSEVGTYTLIFKFSGFYAGNYPSYVTESNNTYLPSSARTTLTVQAESLPSPITSYPHPTEYWTRPIFGENTDWWSISSNWLGTGSPGITGFSTSVSGVRRDSTGDAVGPQTSHIMWTKELQFGGVVGGTANTREDAKGNTWFEGSAYSQRFVNPIIIGGRLFYRPPLSFTGSNSGPLTSVDLRTGNVIWIRPDLPSISFGLVYDVEDPQQHGVYPAMLVSVSGSTWRLFDAWTGDTWFNVTNVPTGTAASLGPQGEQLKYVIANAGNTTNPDWRLAQWNSTRLFSGMGFAGPATQTGLSPTPDTESSTTWAWQNTTTYVNNVPTISSVNVTTTTVAVNGGYSDGPRTRNDWNVSINNWRNTMPTTGSFAPTIVGAYYNDIILMRNGSLPGLTLAGFGPLSSSPYTYFAVNLNASRGVIGSVLWLKTWNPSAGNLTVLEGVVDPVNRIFTQAHKETAQFVGYNLDTGERLWTTANQTETSPLDYYGNPYTPFVAQSAAYGKLYSAAYGGILYTYDIKTGQLLWTYGNGGPGNSTNSGSYLAYGHYPTFVSAIGNGVVYLLTTEHTVNTPIYKGSLARAVNATDGTEIWTLSDYTGTFSQISYAIADGFATLFNGYDNRLYSLGRGPSALTVSDPDLAVANGQPVVIKGTVYDISAGSKLDEQAARFPNGIPLASDSAMTNWMGYVYQQKPLPTNFEGVNVDINVVDANGNFRTIGTTTTDAKGQYNLVWTPDISGTYQVVATFAGTNGYWPSSATTAFNVMEQAPTVAPAPTAAPSTSDLYFVPAIAGLFVFVAIIGVVIILVLRKRP